MGLPGRETNSGDLRGGELARETLRKSGHKVLRRCKKPHVRM